MVFLACFLNVLASHAGEALRYAPGQILVKPKSKAACQKLDRFHAEKGCAVLRQFKTGGLQLIKVPAGETVPGLIAKYKSSGLVEFAEPDHMVTAAATIPNDPHFGMLWGLQNTGQNEGGVPGADIHAPDAWDLQTSASNIVVAVLDTGIRYTHEDLAVNIWVNTNDGSHGFDAFTQLNNPVDDSGHGTLVAGILGAAGNNNLGITGVAWSVQMMSCKCLDLTGVGTDSSVISAMEFASTNGAKIINASFSGPDFSEAVSNTIVSLRDKGIVVVAACGDNWGDVDAVPRYPACYDIDNIVSVAASGDDDNLGFKSNYGMTNVDLTAPGDLMFSTFYAADDSYYPTNYPTERLYGTSFATAYVSGTLALILEKFPAEDYRVSIRRLLLAVDKIPALEGSCVTGGRLNLAYALNAPIQLQFLGSTEASFSLRVSSSPSRVCVVDTSPDLLNWTAVTTNTTSTDGFFDYTDCPINDIPQRFYRARGQ
ncbi:MAG TPA: S8 family peptidase [Candidatus Paceibacterota bacterium]|nr:S8 family peptidase [Candidatus Paceibacterota bacterium]